MGVLSGITTGSGLEVFPDPLVLPPVLQQNFGPLGIVSKLCIDMHLPAVIIELDALLIVNMISGVSAFSKCLSPLVDDCKALLKRIPQHKVKHYFREANAVANSFARSGATMEDDFVVLNFPPAKY
ncbi:hypothetical protein SO802_019765 [Lithocarpus litseifolius]|uniref:RNase H type-1 domain-containing protein n=1 Tax=Lithocarpus litseifolius TaxID=425828 RepID=A0AAW2CRM3_9ROSI